MKSLLLPSPTLITMLICALSVSSLFSKTLDEKIDSLIALMDQKAKIEQVNNNGFMTTANNKSLGIPGFLMADGPHGSHHNNQKATIYPLAMSMGAMWDRDMWYRTGVAMGEEFNGHGVNVQLGPSIDIAHDPRNGRSGEAGGEDSYLIGEFATQVVKGIQTNPVAATIKHFTAVNKQEYRHTSNIKVTEQQIMEQYGYHYRRAIQEGGALAVMSSYNLINGDHTAESPLLLTEILKKRWGFPFMVMSDWWGIKNGVKAINAGNDLCMGNQEKWSTDQYYHSVPPAIKKGTVDIATVDTSVHRIIKTKMLLGLMDKKFPGANRSAINTKEHQLLSRHADQKAMVLLKNNDNILPLPKNKKVLVIGPNAAVPRNNIKGSSTVEPFYTVTPLQGIESKIGAKNVTYIQGVENDGFKISQFKKVYEAAEDADYIIFVGGLNASFEGEQWWTDGVMFKGDRSTSALPSIQKLLLKELADRGHDVVTVLMSGGIMSINESEKHMKALLYAFYTTQEGGNALADILFGDYNPAGRLPVTMPIADSTLPKWDDDFTNDYTGGYRYYDETKKGYQYAFGHGLSYSTFKYSNLTITPKNPKRGDKITVTLDVKNTSKRSGEEVVQLYIGNTATKSWRPKKELKNFNRVAIAAGEKKSISFIIEMEDLYVFNPQLKTYSVSPGTYTISVGGSSDALPLSKTISLAAGVNQSDLRTLHLYSYPRYPNIGEKTQLLASIKNYGTTATQSKSITITWSIKGKTIARSRPITESLLPGQMLLVSSDPDIKESGYWIPKNINSETFTVTIDVDNIEFEYNEKNNSGVFEMKSPGIYKLIDTQ